MKSLIFLTLILFFGNVTISSAQGHENRITTYRIIAIKNGDLSVQSISNHLTVEPGLTLHIPNAFTPNGDGLNDEFGAIGFGVKSYSMKIYNRWGEMLFESNNIEDQWNGTYNGIKVSPGSYVYHIEALGKESKRFHEEGTVSIIKT